MAAAINVFATTRPTGWLTAFLKTLRIELAAFIVSPIKPYSQISIYFYGKKQHLSIPHNTEMLKSLPLQPPIPDYS
jgi:hypothetical protein